LERPEQVEGRMAGPADFGELDSTELAEVPSGLSLRVEDSQAGKGTAPYGAE